MIPRRLVLVATGALGLGGCALTAPDKPSGPTSPEGQGCLAGLPAGRSGAPDLPEGQVRVAGSLAVSPDDRYAASLSPFGGRAALTVWDASDGRIVQRIEGVSGANLSFAGPETLVFSSGAAVGIVGVDGANPRHLVTGHSAATVAGMPDASIAGLAARDGVAVSVGADQTARWMRLDSCTVEDPIGLEGAPTSIALVGEDTALVSGWPGGVAEVQRSGPSRRVLDDDAYLVISGIGDAFRAAVVKKSGNRIVVLTSSGEIVREITTSRRATSVALDTESRLAYVDLDHPGFFISAPGSDEGVLVESAEGTGAVAFAGGSVLSCSLTMGIERWSLDGAALGRFEAP